MFEERVPLYPVGNIRVQVNPEKAFVMLDLTYLTGLGTKEEKENYEHAYAMLEEHVTYLRDALDDALRRIAEARDSGDST